jgi:hypothetical protein
MAFVCPNCGFPQALKIEGSIALPPDSRSDDIILQTVRCGLCRFFGAAIYEESRRGGMDSESWDHLGYALRAGDFEWLSSLINNCPDNRNKNCQCPVHKELGKKDQFGRWLRPEGFSREESFPMRRR